MLEKYWVAHCSLCHGFNNTGSLSGLKEVTHKSMFSPAPGILQAFTKRQVCMTGLFSSLRFPGFLILIHVYIPPSSWHISFFIGSMNVGFVSIFSFVILLSLISFHLELYRERFTKWLIWIVTAGTTRRWFYSHLGSWPHPNLPPHCPTCGCMQTHGVWWGLATAQTSDLSVPGRETWAPSSSVFSNFLRDFKRFINTDTLMFYFLPTLLHTTSLFFVPKCKHVAARP